MSDLWRDVSRDEIREQNAKAFASWGRRLGWAADAASPEDIRQMHATMEAWVLSQDQEIWKPMADLLADMRPGAAGEDDLPPE
jgi:hypothetical protein